MPSPVSSGYVVGPIARDNKAKEEYRNKQPFTPCKIANRFSIHWRVDVFGSLCGEDEKDD